MQKVVQLGEVTCPSGQLVVVDGGYLSGWSGDRSPAEIDPVVLGVDDEALAKEISGSVDFDILGPDAVAAARSFDRQPGTALYDVPASGTSDMAAIFEDHCREHGFDAFLAAREDRVPHRERVRRSADGSFLMFGIPVVAVGGVPADRAVRVEATPRHFGDLGVRWQEISLRVADDIVARSVRLGDVGVDWARLAFADADALGEWRHHAALDGRADVAFWGSSRDEAVAEFGGTELPEGVHGWENLELEAAIERYEAVESWSEAAPDRLLRLDFRPHSHHYQVMRRVRASDHESGTVTVAGAEVLFAMTSWGDGYFPVHADYSPAGELLAVRVVFA
ncbi:hypothetical protein [Actinophytocola oryzae]|uniref:Uncharacterized protein n=1 Tax=Actinophytocola oryzae TaxID=502181 RepID=A0A4R7W2F6_9PSEU|nr:hypothetical protein [Actinophytocola oryzae]TDV56198.1 hypothetical protein CLV71_102264 [Actinophytocola oryzae]